MAPNHIPNYEPAFLNSQRTGHPDEFDDPMKRAKRDEKEIDAAERTLLEGFVEVDAGHLRQLFEPTCFALRWCAFQGFKGPS